MPKRDEEQTSGNDAGSMGRGRALRMSGEAGSGTPTPGGGQAQVASRPARRSCFDCAFYVANVVLWLRTLVSGFPVAGMCANHSDTPGQLRPIPQGGPCRNFRVRHEPPVRVDPPQPTSSKVRYIPLTQGLHAIVDAEDYEWLSQYKWHAQRGGHSRTFYAARNRPGGGLTLMHRMIMRPPKGMVVDHINGNGLDNRRCNLRICTRAQNSRNGPKRAGSKFRFIGVYPRGDKWHVCVTCNGKDHYLGLFDDEVEAAKARDRLASKLFGEYAWLNLPPDAELFAAGQGMG